MYINPYDGIDKEGHWLVTNFHTHAGTGPNTCGAYEIEDVIALYKEAGHGALAISNHDHYSDVTDLQGKYDMVLLNGFEYSQANHMLCIGVKDVIFAPHQEAINESLEQGGFAILCHPNWFKEHWPVEEIDKLTGFTGIEIYNSVIFRLAGSGLATDIWDHLLSQGKLVWGFGNDDFHRWMDLANAWSTIFTEKKDRESLIKAVKKGSFYVSTGLNLDEFSFKDNTISIKGSSRFNYVKNYRYLFIGKDGILLDEQQGERAEYKLKGNEPYVRVQVISEHGAMLWTQPIYDVDFFQSSKVQVL